MYGCEDLPLVKAIPPDTALHDPKKAVRAVRAIAGRYPNEIIRNGEVEPGDIVIVAVGKGPGHVMIVGPQPNTLWHCMQTAGVVRTGFENFGRVLRVWRGKDRHLWLRQQSQSA